jgi:hypothetical protein
MATLVTDSDREMRITLTELVETLLPAHADRCVCIDVLDPKTGARESLGRIGTVLIFYWNEYSEHEVELPAKGDADGG